MSNEVSKTEFLKRYLENEKESDRKRKKKSKPFKPKTDVPCLKIVDRDIDLKSISFGEKADEDTDDEAPVVAEIIDERPEEVKIKELYESSRWKKLGANESSQHDSSMSQETSAERNSRKRHDSDDDGNVPSSQKQNKSKRDSDSDISPPRTHKNKYDNSPRHHQTTKNQNNQFKNSYKRHDSGSDISPPRHQTVKRQDSPAKRSSRRYDSDSDVSPPRHTSVNKNSEQKKTLSRRHHSPPKQKSRGLSESKRQKNQNSDSDLSPPRSPSELSKEKNKKLKKTLSGLKAGLQNSKSLQQEVQELRKKEKNTLESLDDEISGRNAGTIIRDRKTGLKKDFSKEIEAKEEENKKTKEYKEKYDKWGKGTEQTQDKMEKFKDDLYEMSKPLARYKDDADLDERLKSELREEDPMLNYMKKKKQKNAPSFPVYSGPPAPPNRFGILPGYRWDGVVRSNGFEKKYFEKINNTRAVQDEAYLWSVQDM